MAELTPESLERLVLSAMARPEAVERALKAGLRPSSFVVEGHGDVWTYISDMYRADGLVPGASDLLANYRFEALPDVVDVDRYVDRLLRDEVERRLRVSLHRHVEQIAREGADPREELSAIIAELQELQRYRSQASAVFFDDDADDRLAKVRARVAKRAAGQRIGIPTGLATFDNNGGEWVPGDLVAVMGKPTSGKSTLLISFAVRAWYEGYRVVFISPENTADDIHLRADPMAAAITPHATLLSNRQLRTGAPDLDIAAYEDHIDRVKLQGHRRWVTIDRGTQGVFTVADIQAAVAEYRPDVLCVDGAHLIQGAGKTWENIYALGKILKGIAQDKGIAVLAATQATKSAMAAGADVPEMDEAAYGKALMEDANRVISMAKDRGGFKRRTFKVIKWRDGPDDEKRHTLTFDVDAGVIREQGAREAGPEAHGLIHEDEATFA